MSFGPDCPLTPFSTTEYWEPRFMATVVAVYPLPESSVNGLVQPLSQPETFAAVVVEERSNDPVVARLPSTYLTTVTVAVTVSAGAAVFVIVQVAS